MSLWLYLPDDGIVRRVDQLSLPDVQDYFESEGYSLDVDRGQTFDALNWFVAGAGLDDPVFENEAQFKLFKKWAGKSLFVDIKQVSWYDFDINVGDCVEVVEQEEGSPSRLVISLPEDLSKIKVKHLPLIIQQIDLASFWTELPEYASTKEIEKELWNIISYLINKGKKVKKYVELYSLCFWNFEETKLSKDDLVYYDKLFSKKKINAGSLVSRIDEHLGFYFKNQLYESFFEWWSRMLYNYMRERSIYKKDKTILFKDVVDKSKKWSIEEQLINAREINDKENILVLEKRVVDNSFYALEHYKDMWWGFEVYSSPTYILWDKEQRMLCLSKAIVATEVFKKYKIKCNTILLNQHIAVKVTLSDGSEYYFDPTEYDGFFSFERFEYERFRSRVIIEGNEKMDNEMMIMSRLLCNYLAGDDNTDLDRLVSYQLVTKINPWDWMGWFWLSDIYAKFDMVDQSYDAFLLVINQFKDILAKKEKEGVVHKNVYISYRAILFSFLLFLWKEGVDEFDPELEWSKANICGYYWVGKKLKHISIKSLVEEYTKKYDEINMIILDEED